VIEGHCRPFRCHVAAIAGIACVEVRIIFTQGRRMRIVMAAETGALCLGVVERDSGPVRCDVARRAIIRGFKMGIGFAQSRSMGWRTIMTAKAAGGGNHRVIVAEVHGRSPSRKAGVARHAVIRRFQMGTRLGIGWRVRSIMAGKTVVHCRG
jgi:hypothetical protein